MKILCLGSLNLDHVYSLDHFVAAGETIASKDMNIFCGGKGLNQSIALARAGAQSFHAGRIGADGERLRERLQSSGVDVRYVETDPAAPTGHAIIQVDKRGQNCIIICGGTNQTLDEKFIDGALAGFERGDIVLMQNETSCLDYAIKKAASLGLRVALNPSPMDDKLKNSDALGDVTWFILNELEGAAFTGETQPDAILTRMKQRFPSCLIVLTLGKDGAVYYDGENKYTHGIYDVKVADTTAAGDTFAGYFLACVAAGKREDEALMLASKASSIAVSRPGASDSIPTMDEVLACELKLSK